jgi:hypothetical protein
VLRSPHLDGSDSGGVCDAKGVAITCEDPMTPLANLIETSFLNLPLSKPIGASVLTGLHVGLYGLCVSVNVIRGTLMCKNDTLDQFSTLS